MSILANNKHNPSGRNDLIYSLSNIFHLVIYKSPPNEIKKGRTIDYEEYDRLRQLYEQTKNDFTEQIRQNQQMKDHYTKQEENSRQEQIEYLLRLLNLLTENPDFNDDHISLEELRNQFDQQINSFLTMYKDKDKTISSIITKFEEKFSYLFNNNDDDEISLIIEDSNNTILNNLISFLNDLYEHVNKLLHEKRNQRWESKKGKRSTKLSLDDQSPPVLINSHSNNYDSSPQSTIGKKSVRFQFYYFKNKFELFLVGSIESSVEIISYGKSTITGDN